MLLRRSSRLGSLQHGVHLFQGVGQPRGELGTAAVFLDHLQVVGSIFALLVDVRHAAQKRADDDLGVILEEVDLKERKNIYKISLPSRNFHDTGLF